MSCDGCKHPVVPQAYYEEVASEVTENHDTVVLQSKYAAGVLVCDPFNTPAIDNEVQVFLRDVAVINVGAYLYNPQYGYYLITRWNPEYSVVNVRNDGIDGNNPGAFVRANTVFLVAPKPCCQDDTYLLFPFLADDFTAPLLGQSTIINVTSTFGLQQGAVVRIGSGSYYLETVYSSKQIQIRNDGGGATPGSTVVALDANGDYQYLITVDLTSICTSTVTDNSGRLIVCAGSEQKVLAPPSLYDGFVPILINAASNIVEYGLVDTPSIQAAAVTATELANNAVTTTKIAANAVITSKILDEAVTAVKIADAGGGTVFPVTSVVGNIINVSLVGRYWMLGPWAIGQIKGTFEVNGSPQDLFSFTGPVVGVGTGVQSQYPAWQLFGKSVLDNVYTEINATGTTVVHAVKYTTPQIVGTIVGLNLYFFYPAR